MCVCVYMYIYKMIITNVTKFQEKQAYRYEGKVYP